MDVADILVMWPKLFLQLLFPQPLEATYEIWLQLVQLFQKRSRLKVWTDGRRRTTKPDYPIAPQAPSAQVS